MRGVIVTKTRVEKEKGNFGNNLKIYLLRPITFGFIGYLGFFSILLISKYLGFIFGNRSVFSLDSTDFLISMVGFVFLFVVKLKEKHIKKK